MRSVILLFCLAPCLTAAPSPASLQVATPLSFGGLLTQAGGGRVTLTTGGSLLPEGLGVFPGAAPAAAYGRIRLRGPVNAHFQLRAIPSAPVLSGSAGGTVRLAAITAAPAWDGIFGGSGEAEVALGGTLDIPAGTPAGRFSGQVLLQMTAEGLPPATQSMTVTCLVRSPLVLTTLRPLQFAGLLAGSGGRFEVRASGGYVQSGQGPRLLRGTPSPAAFLLSGPARANFILTLPTETTLTGPGGTMRLRDFTCDRPLHGSLPGGGLVFHVGASLMVGDQQAPGLYRGVFQVRAAYP